MKLVTIALGSMHNYYFLKQIPGKIVNLFFYRLIFALSNLAQASIYYRQLQLGEVTRAVPL